MRATFCQHDHFHVTELVTVLKLTSETSRKPLLHSDTNWILKMALSELKTLTRKINTFVLKEYPQTLGFRG